MGRSPLKPLVRARRGPAFVREAGLAISRTLEEKLFEEADVLSEGELRSLASRESYFGSTMIAFDIAAIGRHIREPLDETLLQALERAVAGSVRVRIRAMRLARAEVSRRVPDRPLGTAQFETRTRRTATHLHVDVDLEVPVGVSSRARRR